MNKLCINRKNQTEQTKNEKKIQKNKNKKIFMNKIECDYFVLSNHFFFLLSIGIDYSDERWVDNRVVHKNSGGKQQISIESNFT